MTITSVDAPGPSVWLTSLAVPERVPFAVEGYQTAPVLPRMARTPSPEATVHEDVAPVHGATPSPTDSTVSPPVVATASRSAIAPVAEAPSEPVSDPLAAGLAEALRHQGAAPISGHIVIARLAPRRSPLPRMRPAAPDTDLPNTVEVPPQAVALARSVQPPRRPEAVTRLASVTLSVPELAPRITPTAPVEEAPPLTRAIARVDQCESRLTRAIPRRGRAAEGSAVIAQLASANGRTRDDAVVGEVLQGNVPDFLRDLVPVSFTGPGPNGQPVHVTICVMPDYLAVGSDRDFVRVPLGLPAAMQVAERFDMVLPTTAMVDAIFAQANVRLAPSPMTPGPQMESTGYFQRHNATVQQQVASAGGRLGQLVAGHKKDLVLTNRIERNPGRVAIYGWHRPSGRPIQSLSTVHGAQYADYSHGIRLVSRTAYVNGRATDLRDLLADGRYAGMISSEGPITNLTLLAGLR